MIIRHGCTCFAARWSLPLLCSGICLPPAIIENTLKNRAYAAQGAYAWIDSSSHAQTRIKFHVIVSMWRSPWSTQAHRHAHSPSCSVCHHWSLWHTFKRLRMQRTIHSPATQANWHGNTAQICRAFQRCKPSYASLSSISHSCARRLVIVRAASHLRDFFFHEFVQHQHAHHLPRNFL
jgi:hypothetical protein